MQHCKRGIDVPEQSEPKVAPSSRWNVRAKLE
jgi:hypothetical protein